MSVRIGWWRLAHLGFSLLYGSQSYMNRQKIYDIYVRFGLRREFSIWCFRCTGRYIWGFGAMSRRKLFRRGVVRRI